MEFSEFADGHWGLAGQTLELVHNGGLHRGNYFLKWMRDLLKAKGI
jgi:hypothetical protein